MTNPKRNNNARAAILQINDTIRHSDSDVYLSHPGRQESIRILRVRSVNGVIQAQSLNTGEWITTTEEHTLNAMHGARVTDSWTGGKR